MGLGGRPRAEAVLQSGIMSPIEDLSARLKLAINRQRLIETVVRLVEVPSRTGEARGVCDRLAEILAEDGFNVERPAGGYAASPAVAVRFDSGRPGRTLQFEGHLDTVHLPFVPPNVEDGRITGSGSCDMKGGIAAAVEALRALREAGVLAGGSILLTAHDLHEAPWGDGRQLNQLIADGYVGDAVLLPEPLDQHLPIRGRGQAMWWRITDPAQRAPSTKSSDPVTNRVSSPQEPNWSPRHWDGSIASYRAQTDLCLRLPQRLHRAAP